MASVGEIRQSMKLIDVVIDLDARAPRATANPYLDEALGTKPRVLVLNKADLADARSTQAWLEALREKSVAAAPADCQRGAGVKEAIKLAEQVAQSSGLDGGGVRLRRRFRTVVVGIPNVGKSSFINRAAGRWEPGRATDRRDSRQTMDRSSPNWRLDTPGLCPRVGDPRLVRFGRSGH